MYAPLEETSEDARQRDTLASVASYDDVADERGGVDARALLRGVVVALSLAVQVTMFGVLLVTSDSFESMVTG